MVAGSIMNSFLLNIQSLIDATKPLRKPAPAVLLASERVLDSCSAQNESAKAFI